MRGKLSQAGRTLVATGLFPVIVAVLSVGCRERLDPSEFGEASSRANSDWSMPWKASRGQNAPFSWPENAENPIVEIEIDGASASGTIAIELAPELAPKTVAQFLEWVESGYYVGTTFHRVIDGFMIQGGDPNSRDRLPRNDGKGGPGFALQDEFSRAPFVRGVVGMGNKGRPDSAGSQFFIMQGDQPSLNGRYTVIGRVVTGMEIVDAITQVEIDKVGRWGPKDRPVQNVVMSKLARVEASAAAVPDATAEDASAETSLASQPARSPRD